MCDWATAGRIGKAMIEGAEKEGLINPGEVRHLPALEHFASRETAIGHLQSLRFLSLLEDLLLASWPPLRGK